MVDKRFIKFGLVGGVSTFVDFVVLNLLLYVNPSLVLATSLGYTAGFFTSYALNSHWTFRTPKEWKSLLRFTLMNVASLIFTNIIVVTGVDFGWNHNIAKIVAVIIVFFWNYLISKYWVFTHEQD